MKLLYTNASPYARKVRIAIAEKGLHGIEQVAVDPFDLPYLRRVLEADLPG